MCRVPSPLLVYVFFYNYSVHFFFCPTGDIICYLLWYRFLLFCNFISLIKVPYTHGHTYFVVFQFLWFYVIHVCLFLFGVLPWFHLSIKCFFYKYMCVYIYFILLFHLLRSLTCMLMRHAKRNMHWMVIGIFTSWP